MHINVVKVNNITPVMVDPIVERHFIIDCSGSMYSDIPLIREQMKKKIPEMTKVGDRVSIFWFSSTNQCAAVVEGFEINSKADYRLLKMAIDKNLYARGCTGFKDPIDLATASAARSKAGSSIPLAAQMFFMTDGYDNCWSTKEIIDSIKKASDVFDSIAIVEYGWNCNRALLNQMASAVGAVRIFSEDFRMYDGAFEENLVKQVGFGTKKIEVSLPETPWNDVAFYRDGKDVVCVDSINGKVLVPESVSEVKFLSSKDSKAKITDDSLLEGILVTSQRMCADETLDFLDKLGDKALIDKFVNCFSKQDYSDFQGMVQQCLETESSRFSQGKVKGYLPAPDAFTVIDLLELLSSSEENLLYVYDPSFKYERISAAGVDSHSVIKDEEKERLMQEIKDAKTPEDLAKATKALQDLQASKVSLKFQPADKTKGYAIRDLVYNETRSNVSVKVLIPGFVEIPEECPHKSKLPSKINTVIFRNYAMIKDGIKHSSMKCLPMTLGKATFDTLQSLGVIDVGEEYDADTMYLINANLPVINRKMATKVSAKSFFTDVVGLLHLKAHQKVYNSLMKGEGIPDSFASAFGEEEAAWLKERGLTSSGFNPPMVKGESLDEYKAVEFKVSVAKCSSLPKIDDTLFAKVRGEGKKPMTVTESMCAPALLKYWDFQASDAVKSSKSPEKVTLAWLEAEAKDTLHKVREKMLAISKVKLSIMVGHTWFTEFKSLEENSMDITLGDVTYSCSAVCREITVKL